MRPEGPGVLRRGVRAVSPPVFRSSFTERLWRSVKYEEVYLNDYRTPRDARQGLAGYLTFYNTVRPHQALGYATPAAVYTGEVTLE